MSKSLPNWALCLSLVLLSACGGGSDPLAPLREPNPPVAGDPSGGMGADLPAEASDEPLVDAADLPGAEAVYPPPSEQIKNTVVVAEGTLLTRSDFEGSYTSTAPGWRVNYWGSVRFETARETRATHVHSGASAQRFRVVERASGADAHLIYPYGFVNGRSYRVALYLRTDTAAEVEVQLRRDAHPWDVFARQVVKLGSGWTRVELGGTFRWSDPGSIRIVSRTPGAAFYIDDMSLAEVVPATTTTTTTSPTPSTTPTTEPTSPGTATEPAPTEPVVSGGLTLPAAGNPAVSVTTLLRSTMEGSYASTAPGWRANYWGTPTPTFELSRESRAGYVQEGSSSQRFRMVTKGGGDVHLYHSYAFVKGRTYRATAWLRSDVPARVTFFMRRDAHPWDAFATRTLELGPGWQKVEIQGAYMADVGGSLRLQSHTPGANVWMDDVTLAQVDHNDLAPFSTETLPDTLFGMHVNKFGSHQNWPGLGQRVLRLHNTGTHWRNVEPANNAWDWRRLDLLVDYARRNDPNGTILYTMGMTPQWASSNPTQGSMYGAGAAAAPANMEDWRDYVRTIARRYAGHIRHWELWNEPDYKGHWTGSIDQMLTMTRIAHEELKAADPANVLVSPGLTASQGAAFLDNFLSGGGGRHVDAIGFHWYYDVRPEALATKIENVRQIMRNHGVGERPLWNTEGAPLCNAEWQTCSTWVPTLEEQRSVNARALLTMAAKGVANFNFYFWEDTVAIKRLVQSDWLTPTPAAEAYAEAIRWMKGARVTDAFRVDDNVHVFRMNRGSETYTVLWAARGATLVNLPAAWGASRLRALDGSETALPASRQISIGLEPVLLK
ncbi:glycosyl hydrolase [Caldimonas tepidiphila]|uniref:glycosyl hydrolase n=1 Tax=Caldimonas tepidiphila TaxID=2315841 RepID=UPI0013007442|nr:glycosyl hydrolase [Caldimonas tepidiphila]